MNYFVVGPNGERYGPADLATLNQWVGEGRVKADSLVQAEGDIELVPASQIEGIALALDAPAAAPTDTGSATPAPVPGPLPATAASATPMPVPTPAPASSERLDGGPPQPRVNLAAQGPPPSPYLAQAGTPPAGPHVPGAPSSTPYVPKEVPGLIGSSGSRGTKFLMGAGIVVIYLVVKFGWLLLHWIR